MENEKIELKAIHDSRNSFGGKAKTQEQKGRLTLFSYQTDIAYIENGKAFVLDEWSMTTTRHIKEFLLQNGFKAENKKQILKDYSEIK